MFSFWERKVSLGRAAFVCLTAATAGALAAAGILHWNTDSVETKLHEIDTIASKYYVGDWDEEGIADYAAIGYVTGLNDQWAAYLTEDQYAQYQMESDGKTCGIGVSVISAGDTIRVYLVYADSSAAAAGLEKGDCILGAEGVTVAQDGTDEVVEAIQGEEGTEVTITVQKAADGSVQTLTMRRAIVAQTLAWGKMLDGNVGYIRIESFHDGVADQFRQTMDDLIAQGAQSLVLDVRHNGGGLIREMSEMLDPLLPEGTIITLRNKTGNETVYTSDADMIDLPIAVLIDDQTISAAEFFAAALQEYGRATLVGTHTTGKGYAQRTYELSDGSALHLSVEEYFTPKGVSLAGVGIAPDVEVALSEEQQASFYFLTPENDTQLQKALENLN